jgi:hypothetical protein
MVGQYLSASATSGSQWTAAGFLLLPFVAGALFGGLFAFLMRKLGWPSNVTTTAPISAMFGVLSYVVMMAVDPMISGNFSLQAIWSGIVVSLISTWPIALVIGPMFFIYVAQLKKGRKIFKDSTVIVVSIVCLISEFVFIKVVFDNAS